MAKKLKFKPVIIRVKLNPEQAVLICDCYKGTRLWAGHSYGEGVRHSGLYCTSKGHQQEYTICMDPTQGAVHPHGDVANSSS